MRLHCFRGGHAGGHQVLLHGLNGRVMVRAAITVIVNGLAALAAGTAAFAAAGPSGADAEWSMPSKDYAATRYSPLASITTDNARGLHPVWTFSTGVLG